MQAMLSADEQKAVISRARSEIFRLMVIEDSVLSTSQRDAMVARAIRRAMQFVVGHANVAQPETAKKSVVAAMAEVRRAFKQYALCHIHNEFGLRAGPDHTGSAIEYRAQRVGQLLENFWYLRDPSNEEGKFFSSPFFRNYIIDMLFLAPMELWKYMENDDLTMVIRLGGTALAATLHDFRNGYHQEGDVSAALWRDRYIEISQLIITMQGVQARRDWLVNFQQFLMAQGHALQQNCHHILASSG